MKKLMDSFEKTPASRLLDSASRSSSTSGILAETALYQNYQNGDSCSVHAERNVNQPDAKARRAKFGDGGGEATNQIVHRIRANDFRDPLCILGCCGQGHLTILWTSGKLDPRSLSNGDLTVVGNSATNHGNEFADVTAGHPHAPGGGGGGAKGASNGGPAAGALDDPPCDSPDVPSLGRLQFGVAYDFPEMTLTLHILRAVKLPAKDMTGTSDPYVKVLLLPDKKRKITTNVKRKNLNPRWNEVFAFEGFPYSKLMNRTLYLQVLDYDRFSRDDPIGEVCIPLSDFDLVTGQTIWKNLQPCKGHTGKLGEVNVGLCYHPTNEQLTVTVHEARALKAKDINGLSDPYVKIWMLHDGKKAEKKKTEVKEKTLNPVFAESFAFAVPYDRVRQTSLSVIVMDYDRMGRNELIGRVVLGSKSGPMEVKHWNEMFAKSRQMVSQWHVLKDFG